MASWPSAPTMHSSEYCPFDDWKTHLAIEPLAQGFMSKVMEQSRTLGPLVEYQIDPQITGDILPAL
jgi:hypothetical protein